MAVAWLVVMTGTATADRVWVFQGRSVHASECQRDVKVRFDVTVHNGRLRHVTEFRVSHLNFPSETPPIPFGRPSGNCLPGENAFVFQNYHKLHPAAMLFDGP
jgi:hypothetical protein